VLFVYLWPLPGEVIGGETMPLEKKNGECIYIVIVLSVQEILQ
jgi:hypothetical protein